MVSFTFAHTYTYIHTQFHSLSFFLFFFSRIDTFRVTSIQRISFAIFFLFPRLPVFLLPFPFFLSFLLFLLRHSSSIALSHSTQQMQLLKKNVSLSYVHKRCFANENAGERKKKRKKRKRKTFDNEISRKIVSFLRFLFRFRVPSLLISSI